MREWGKGVGLGVSFFLARMEYHFIRVHESLVQHPRYYNKLQHLSGILSMTGVPFQATIKKARGISSNKY